MGTAGYPEPRFTRIRLNFIHFDIQSRNQDIWLPSKRFIVTPLLCPRLYEFLTTLTCGALRKTHILSTAFDVEKKKAQDRNNESSLSTCGQQCLMNRQEHKRSWEKICLEKQELTSMAVPQRKAVVVHYYTAMGVFPLRDLLKNKKHSARKKLVVTVSINSKTRDP